MKISVFTPTHNPEYILDCYESLKAQTLQDWEWILFLNGNAANQYDHWLKTFGEDPRVIVIGYYNHADGTNIKGVGDAKRTACERTSGDILFELDHDDTLHPEALQEVLEAFEKHPDVGVISSNFTQINADKTPNFDRFGEVFGWIDKYRETEINGIKYLECIGFNDHPHNYARIYSQPNHLRAFRKSIYEEVGGYNADFDILDDQDLLCRMYIAAPVHKIDKLLYFQRVYAGNTQKQFTDKITPLCEELYLKYFENMAIIWAQRQGLLSIDLGAGYNAKKGMIGLDLRNSQIIADVTKGMPFGDNSVGVFRAHDFMEHLTDKIGLINEIYRCLAHGGILISQTPSTDGWGAFSDPTHVAFYNERSFHYYTRENQRRFVPEIKAKFQESYIQTKDTSNYYGPNVKHIVANLIALKSDKRDFQGRLFI
ncbi:MAG: glycosyltransferase [Candidatus Pacearchaeota archaeon]